MVVDSEIRQQDALDRLDRLESYLRIDPANELLLCDAFNLAVQCSAWERAERILRAAQNGHAADTQTWTLRACDLLLAQKAFDKATALLLELSRVPHARPEILDGIDHSHAYVDFAQGAYQACADRLSKCVNRANQNDRLVEMPPAATCCLWLRAQHRLGKLREAFDWIVRRAEGRELEPDIAGIGSLIAVDLAEMDAARSWSMLGLANAEQDMQQPEALVAGAAMLLASKKAVEAIVLLDRALRRNPNDGRTWSTRGFAQLLSGELPGATHDFDEAVKAMPTHIGTWLGRAWANVLQKEFSKAESDFEAALKLDHNFAESHGGLAVALAFQKKSVLAREHAEIARRLDKHNLSGRYADALLTGEISSSESLVRLARRLVGSREIVKGIKLSGWIAHESDDPGP